MVGWLSTAAYSIHVGNHDAVADWWGEGEKTDLEVVEEADAVLFILRVRRRELLEQVQLPLRRLAHHLVVADHLDGLVFTSSGWDGWMDGCIGQTTLAPRRPGGEPSTALHDTPHNHTIITNYARTHARTTGLSSSSLSWHLSTEEKTPRPIEPSTR